MLVVIAFGLRDDIDISRSCKKNKKLISRLDTSNSIDEPTNLIASIFVKSKFHTTCIYISLSN